MSVPTFFDRVLFNDGEGIDHADFNTLQQMMRAQVADTLWSMHARLSEAQYVPTVNTQIWVPTGSHAMAKAGGSNLQVVSTAGLIAQYATATDPDGATPRMLQYWLAANDITQVCNAADATNPRFDLIAVKLTDGVASASTSKDFQDAITGAVTTTSFNKRTSTTLTVSYVPGTPAGSPAFPAIPAGFAAWAYVYVPATYATTFVQDTHIIDVRHPVGFRSIVIPAHDMGGWDAPASTLALAGTMEVTEGTGAGSVMRAMLPIGPTSRVMTVAAYGSGSWATPVFKRYDYSAAGISKNNIGTLPGFATISGPAMGGTLSFTNPPVWGNGRHSPYNGSISGIDGNGVALEFTTGAAGDKIRMARFYVLGF
jgi:hypothetical protein